VVDINSAELAVMTPKERADSCVLVVEPDAAERNNMRVALRNLGFGGVSDAANHAAALERLDQRKFTHIIFDAKPTNMPSKEFLGRVLEINSEIICIPSSFEPNVDDVFDLLAMGAKGYLVKPFTTDTVETSLDNATKGEPISEAVLGAKDRNEALVAIMMQCLDKTALVIRQAQQFETAEREIPLAMAAFRRASGLANTFAKGGEEGLLGSLEEFCIERSKGPATRLGRLRKRLKHKQNREQ
jgi:DNA-binding NarL/FixJ family response regulator